MGLDTYLLQHYLRHPHGVSLHRAVRCRLQHLQIPCRPCIKLAAWRVVRHTDPSSPREVPFVSSVPFQKASPKCVHLFYVVEGVMRTTRHRRIMRHARCFPPKSCHVGACVIPSHLSAPLPTQNNCLIEHYYILVLLPRLSGVQRDELEPCDPDTTEFAIISF